jgi:hypothetical protein
MTTKTTQATKNSATFYLSNGGIVNVDFPQSNVGDFFSAVQAWGRDYDVKCMLSSGTQVTSFTTNFTFGLSSESKAFMDMAQQLIDIIHPNQSHD